MIVEINQFQRKVERFKFKIISLVAYCLSLSLEQSLLYVFLLPLFPMLTLLKKFKNIYKYIFYNSCSTIDHITEIIK